MSCNAYVQARTESSCPTAPARTPPDHPNSTSMTLQGPRATCIGNAHVRNPSAAEHIHQERLCHDRKPKLPKTGKQHLEANRNGTVRLHNAKYNHPIVFAPRDRVLVDSGFLRSHPNHNKAFSINPCQSLAIAVVGPRAPCNGLGWRDGGGQESLLGRIRGLEAGSFEDLVLAKCVVTNSF